jgi:hypothetical protein
VASRVESRSPSAAYAATATSPAPAALAAAAAAAAASLWRPSSVTTERQRPPARWGAASATRKTWIGMPGLPVDAGCRAVAAVQGRSQASRVRRQQRKPEGARFLAPAFAIVFWRAGRRPSEADARDSTSSSLGKADAMLTPRTSALRTCFASIVRGLGWGEGGEGGLRSGVGGRRQRVRPRPWTRARRSS